MNKTRQSACTTSVCVCSGPWYQFSWVAPVQLGQLTGRQLCALLYPLQRRLDRWVARRGGAWPASSYIYILNVGTQIKIWFQSNLYAFIIYYIYIILETKTNFGSPRSVVKATMVVIFIYNTSSLTIKNIFSNLLHLTLRHANSSAVFRYPIFTDLL